MRNMVLNMKHIKLGNGRIITMNLILKMPMHLADLFNAPYEMFLESKVKEDSETFRRSRYSHG